MANTKFPVIINGVKFQVNPTGISINKPLMKGTLNTQDGVRFQIWYAQPEVVTISGLSAGETAYQELLFMKSHFERTTTQRVSELYYKTKTYKGFIDNITVGHTIGEHLRFPYSITFQLLHGEQFAINDLALQPSGLVEELQDAIEENINAPIARTQRAIGKTIGKIL